MITRPFFPSPEHTNQCFLSGRFELLALIVVLLSVGNVYGQFNSGSTGADGALNTANLNCPSNICELQLPESGVFNFTTIAVEWGRQIRFRPNSRNTPVVLLAQGDVSIAGGIEVSAGVGSMRSPGPGGYWGGSPGRQGFGPGGRSIDCALGRHNGVWTGPLILNPIVGGSGGAGACGLYGESGGGGGAIVIASSTSITLGPEAQIRANGAGVAMSCGSGGAIRIVANSLNIAGALHAHCNSFHFGVIRLEAASLIFSGTSLPLAVQSAINPIVVASNVPRLSIASIGGFSIPANSGSRFDLVDVLLPNQLPDPIYVSISANNIPTGTQVQVGIVSGSPSGTSTPCNLSGTFANSSCTATISNLTRTGGTYLLATAAFDPPASVAAYNPKGKDHVAKVRLDSVYGGGQKYVFLRADGSVIDATRISRKFLQEFGM